VHDIFNLPVAAVIDAIVQEKKDEEKNRKKYDKMW
jgi:malate dehydrogenase (oxaloacetate-decarboxylating)(NADP+)